MRHADDLRRPVLALNDAGDTIDAGTLLTHLFGIGQSGSGKSSALLAAILRASARLGCGLLSLNFKAGSAAETIGYLLKAGRARSFIHWRDKTFRFNVLQYYVSRFGINGIGSIVQCLMTCLEIIRLAGAVPGKIGEEFWQATTWNKLANSVPILFGATGTVRIADLLRFIRSAPHSAEQMNDPAWRAQSAFVQMFQAAQPNLDEATFQRCLDYWQQDYSPLDARARSNIHISIVTALSKLNQGILGDVLCQDTNIVPELCMSGVSIVMDFPPSIYGDDGIILQKIFKYCWQEAMLLRPALPEPLQRRICLLVADECQEFVTPRDTFFFATCRSMRVGVVYLTQSLPTLISRIGGDNPKERVEDLLSHFSTKVFLANSCFTTNQWASNTIGRIEHWRESFNASEGRNSSHGLSMGDGTNWGTSSSAGGGGSSSANGGYSSNTSWSAGRSSGGNDSRGRNRGSGTSDSRGWSTSMTMDVAVEPGFFARVLRTGGHANGGIVDALWFQSGRRFHASGTNYVLVEFRQ